MGLTSHSMQNISLSMAKKNKQKLLGQYYSGSKIAKALFELLKCPHNKTVIDPMCGSGDLLRPFYASGNTVFGIELDDEAYIECLNNLSCSHDRIQNKNAFSSESLEALNPNGYDIVITNPPYIRRENYKLTESEIEGALSMDCIKQNLSSFCDELETINADSKAEIKSVVANLSGLADIAALSLILCMLLVKENGYLAIVVPNSWIGREYSLPIVKLLIAYFEIEFVINDVNSVWFKGDAQVQTSLVVAQRKDTVSQSNQFYYVDLYKQSVDDNSITSFVPKNQTFYDFLTQKRSLAEYCEIKMVFQHNFFDSYKSLSPISKLNYVCTETISYCTLEDFGINCGQGFRSGANAFFILDKRNGEYTSGIKGVTIRPIRYFVTPIIHNQKLLLNTISITDPDMVSELLTIGNSYATERDIRSLPTGIQHNFIALPSSISDYIEIAADSFVGGTKIPELSAVKTNIRTKEPYRFWYHLPPFSSRHKGKVFFPRVNGREVISRFNPNRFVVDANFISLWAKDSCFEDEGILAITSSTWFKVLCEENGIVMGGGALKLDAIQLKKMLFPPFSAKEIKQLNKLGRELSSTTVDGASEIISRIDSLFMTSLGIKKNKNRSQKKLTEILEYYIKRRLK